MKNTPHSGVDRANLVKEHPWVTKRGTDPLLSKEENISVLVDPPTEEELNAAITGNMGHLMAVVSKEEGEYPNDRLTPL